MTNALLNAISTHSEQLADQTKTVTGGDYKPPAEGRARARLVGYIELGVQPHKNKNIVKMKPTATLLFELSGKNHAPREGEGGKLYPHIIPVKLPYSLNSKANFKKVFNIMNRKDAKNFAQLVGEPYLVTIKHDVVGEGDNKRTYVSIRNDAGAYTISPPVFVDEDENVRAIEVAAPISPLRVFVWDLAADPAVAKLMWDSLFIDGQTDQGKSRNVYQDLIRAAENFEGSPIHNYLLSIGDGKALLREQVDVDDGAHDDDADLVDSGKDLLADI